jgi:acetyl-CoA carboxylase alpha subunit
LKEAILNELSELKKNINKDFLDNRVARYDKLGTFRED